MEWSYDTKHYAQRQVLSQDLIQKNAHYASLRDVDGEGENGDDALALVPFLDLLNHSGRYRVFIKYCVFSLKFCDYSELCHFCCSAGVLPACSVYTH